jgi:GxxExxY protein
MENRNNKKVLKPEKLIYPEESFKIVGACYNVYNDKGCGFLEAVYHECLKIEFEYQNIPFLSQVELQLSYREVLLNQTYKVDFICYDKIIVEIKSVSKLIDEHRAQIQNYINASNLKLGLLINFGHYPGLEYERYAYTDKIISTK